MDEIWERAIKTALDGETDYNSVKNLTLDGAVKCFQGRFPPPSLLEKFCNLEHLSIANAGVSSLENFPNLPKLEKLVLSDNRIAGGLEFLVKAGLDALRDLDLSNNRIQFISDLVPLAQLKVVSLDLYQCPVTKVENYRGAVLELVRSVKYLDKMDADENERLESDDEDEVEDDDDDEEVGKLSNGVHVVDVDEDEEESEMVKGNDGAIANEEELDGEDDEVEEIYEDEEVIEVHEIEDSDDEDDDSDDSDDELEEVDDEEDVDPVSTGRLTSTEGEIDGHGHGEEDENGESGEEDELSSEEDGTFGDDENGTEFLVQPAGQHEEEDVGGSDDYSGEEEEVDDEGVLNVESQSQPSTSSQSKRKRDEDDSVEEDDDNDEVVEDINLQAHPSTSALLKKKRNGVVGDAKD